MLRHKHETANTLCLTTHTTRFAVKLTLYVRYPDDYPDVLPELSIEAVEGEVDDGEIDHLLNELRSVVCVSHMPQKN